MVAASLLCFVLTSTVTLHYKDSSARRVQFAGDLYGWSDPQPMRHVGADWSIALQIPDDARFEYKFVVDGKWTLDPTNPKKLENGVGGENSVYEGPKYRLRTLEHAPKHPIARSTIKVDGREIIVYAPEHDKPLPLLIYGDGPNYERYGKV